MMLLEQTVRAKMIQCNVNKEDMLLIDPWTSIKNVINIQHPRVIYGFLGAFLEMISQESQFIFIASYNGDGGFFHTLEDGVYRLGTTFTTTRDISLPPNLHKLFATNMNVMDHRIIVMPYGACDVYQHDVAKDLLCYARFSTWTSHVRPQIRSWCEAQPFIKSEFSNNPSEQNDSTLYNYFLNLHRAKFTICPPGNGPDTYRVWEALYSNTIPIVIDCPLYRNFDLPILRVNSFAEVTEELLHQTYMDYCTRKWKYEQLRLSYYNALIQQAFDEINNHV